MPTNEEILKSSLMGISSAAACFPPYGTVASAAIMGGLQIHGLLSQIEEAEIQAKYTEFASEEREKIKKLIDDTYKLAKRRPRVPLDLYAAPPMYWIFSSEPSISDAQSFRVPGGSVDWPSGSKGGKSVLETVGIDKSNIEISNIYAPFPPDRVPKLCVFFWSVPLFFARLQETIGNVLFGDGHNPQDIADVVRFGGKTKEKVSEGIMKEVLLSGEFDSYGNWSATIGSAIPPLAVSDSEFASRYYGRELWAHNFVKKQISYSDGTALCDTSIPGSKSDTGKMAERISVASARRSVCPRIASVPGTPYGSSILVSKTPVPMAGVLMDLHTLLSNYYIDDDEYRSFKSDGGINVNSQASDDDRYLYYVTVAKDSEQVVPSVGNIFAQSEKCEGDNLKIVYYGIKHSGPFNAYLATKSKKSQFFDGLNLCPYQFAVAPTFRANSMVETAVVNNGFSSFGFFDFDQSDELARMPGVEGVVGSEKFSEIRKLAITPVTSADLSIPFCDSIRKTKYFIPATNFGSSNAVSESIRKAYAAHGIIATNHGEKSASVYRATQEYFTPRVLKFSKFEKNELQQESYSEKSGYAALINTVNGKVSDLCPKVYPIVKLRAPLQSDSHRIWLPESMYGDAKWAKRQMWDEFAIANPPLPAGYRLVVVRVMKDEDQKFQIAQQSKPKTALYCRSSLEENKPIINSGQHSPSPFYCGRRADSRSQFAWKQIRDATSNYGKPAKEENQDTGWEDCHDWSWPYPTKLLNGIGKVSDELCKKYGEGIGRCGLSESSVATGPTLWGDVSLFNKTIAGLVYNNDPSSPEFIDTKARIIWETLIEVQVGANTRYGFRTCQAPKSYTEIIEERYGIFSNSEKSYNHYLEFAKQKQKNGVSPKIWIPEQKRWQELTPDQAAQYCVKVIDKWYREMVPVPNKDHNDRYLQSSWSLDLLKSTAEAHIQLKNWALDRFNFKFPSKYFSIDTLKALSLKSRIIQYNPFFLKELMPVYSQAKQTVSQDADPEVSHGSSAVKIAAGIVAGAAAISAAIAIYTSIRGKR